MGFDSQTSQRQVKFQKEVPTSTKSKSQCKKTTLLSPGEKVNKKKSLQQSGESLQPKQKSSGSRLQVSKQGSARTDKKKGSE